MWEYLHKVQDGSQAQPAGGILNSFESWVSVAANVLIAISFIMAMVEIAYSGILYVTSSGDPKKAGGAWRALLWGIIASLLTLSMLAIRNAFIVSLDVDPIVSTL